MNIKLSIFITTLLIVLSGCEAKKYGLLVSNTPVATKSFSSAKYEYKIQPHDRLLITSYKFPNLIPQPMNNNGILVNSAGNIFLPLINRIKVAGLSQTEASRKLERAFKKYIRKPSINVEAMNKRVFVLGEVKKPGVVKLDKEQTTLLEILAFSGDLTDNAARDNIIILSKNSIGKLYIRQVNLTRFSILSTSNMILRNGDIVYVQPNKWKKYKVQANNIDSIVSIIAKLSTPYLIFK